MSTHQAYYKDRLGFDPKEALYDGPPHEKYRKTDDLKQQPQGYEENLTKFKGTIWSLFIEFKGTVVGFNSCKHGVEWSGFFSFFGLYTFTAVFF